MHIRLIAPGAGQTTDPLQQYSWDAGRSAPAGIASGLLEDDRSLPRAVAFAWETLDPRGAPIERGLRYDLELTAMDSSREKLLVRGLFEPFALVENLRVGIQYRWKVRTRRGIRTIESPEGVFFTHPALPRWIHAPGITNVRDLGGWPLPGGRRVRQGLFFRGSELNSHCTISGEGRRVLEEVLGIRTDLDLRGPEEEREAVLNPRLVRYQNIPLASYDMIASREYTVNYRSLFELLADYNNYPVYIHCWGGADRTGTVVFLLGALLGMRPEDLVADYELTSLSVWGERREDSEAYRDLRTVLAGYAPAGSDLQTQAQAYLRAIGLSDEKLAKIQSILTEP